MRSAEYQYASIMKKTKSETNLFAGLSAPAQRALANAGIKTISQLAKYSERELLKLHGLGPSAIPKLKTTLESEGLHFRQ
jgi:predicted RecB family nuclease